MISYEISLGLSIIGVAMVFESLKLSEISRAQGELIFGFIPKWGVVVQPLGFILFLVAAFAESARIPFDLPEGESELVAGFHTEYGSFKCQRPDHDAFLRGLADSLPSRRRLPPLQERDPPSLVPGGAHAGGRFRREGALLLLVIHMGAVDNPPVPVRPGHEARVEGAFASFPGKYLYHRGRDTPPG
jgi:hypothetical protein